MRSRRRRGFTLIELLVVIGIILVLVAIVVLGLRHVNYTTARRETIAEMKICSDMLNEYKNINGYKNIEDSGLYSPPNNQLILPPPWGAGSGVDSRYGGSTVQLPVFDDSQPDTKTPQPQSTLRADDFQGVQNGSATQDRDMGDKTSPARYNANAVQWTRAVMYLVLATRKNRSTIANVPSKRILETWPQTSGSASTTTTANTMDAAMVLDGWGNPIVYVPRGGMHVWMKPSGILAEYIVRSSGTYLLNQLPPLGPNDHPFFASAGQDGFFTDALAGTTDYAIDNIYSFQD